MGQKTAATTKSEVHFISPIEIERVKFRCSAKNVYASTILKAGIASHSAPTFERNSWKNHLTFLRRE